MDETTKKKIRKEILNKTIYKRIRYRRWRTKVFERDRFKCQLCEKIGSSIQAHHIKPKYKYPEKIFEVANGITLCYGCHQKIHDQDLAEKYAKKFRSAARKNRPRPKIKKIRKIRRI